jgi:hypothetical protein
LSESASPAVGPCGIPLELALELLVAGVELALDVAGAELDEPPDELDEPPPPPQPDRARTRATSAASRPAARREVMVML